MSDKNDYEGIPTDKWDRLTYSITNLWEDLGNADDPKVGLFISIILTLFGVFIYVNTSGWVALVAAVWAILSILGPIKWVLGL